MNMTDIIIIIFTTTLCLLS